MLPPFRPANARPIPTPKRQPRLSPVNRVTDDAVLDGVRPARLPVRATAVAVRARPLLAGRAVREREMA